MTSQKSGLVATVIGAIVSVASLFYVGARGGNNIAQPVVMILIGLWVVSPFVILFLLHKLSASWSSTSRTTLYRLMLLIAVVSLVVYLSVAIGPPRAKAAPPFVVVPPISWLIIAISLSVAAIAGRRRT